MPSSTPAIAKLVSQLPDTDADLDATQKAQPDKLGRPSKFTGPDPNKAEALFAEALAGGTTSLAELIRLIRPPGHPDFKSFKAEYFLHGLAVHAARPGREPARALLVNTLAAQLANPQLPNPVRAFLARELQFVGDATAAAALGRLLADDTLCDPAAAALVAIRDGAAAQFLAAWPSAHGRRRLVIIQSLAALRDPTGLPTLRQALADPHPDVRHTAAWGLAQLASPAAIPDLLKAADAADPFERIQSTHACMLLAERLAGAGNTSAATRIYTHLRNTRTHPKEHYLRDAAQKAMDRLGASATS
ncbi:MAG: HEAT repeat domain-containing protein [Verrucomicrobia bacterium]|nr:HEAT repeat domain-containing protein [Verrucomicrobiota bacterium]